MFANVGLPGMSTRPARQMQSSVLVTTTGLVLVAATIIASWGHAFKLVE